MTIRPTSPQDISALRQLAITTFLAAHGTSASAEDLNHFLDSFYTDSALMADLGVPNTHHLVATAGNNLIGFSKMTLYTSNSNTTLAPIARLDRLYIQQAHYGSGLSKSMLSQNIAHAQQYQQLGLWLNVWTGNARAISFYAKMGFEKIGDYLYPISPKHANPNYQMLLRF